MRGGCKMNYDMTENEKQLDERIKGYLYLMTHDNGNQEDILDINPDFLDEFASAGFITFGIDALATPRFTTTTLGKEYAKQAYVALACELAQKELEKLAR